ncbi:PASTA domain-containing protein [Millisia brevis]|uniref:PASTA domain-containing protein n=1 Tax=Millisia brevis TaxID=264148 RepID=UPI000A071E2A|nr:PASTA domain-containing protein [Millisia brevis]
MRRALMLVAVPVAAWSLAACTIETNPEVVTVTVSADPTTPSVVPTTTAAPATTTPQAPQSPPAAIPPATGGSPTIEIGRSVPMPDVVCMNLQLAQDTIQAAGVFFSRSVDATGADRMQVIDRNWIVVSQQPAPGVEVGEGEAVLSVVRDTEPNTC